MLEQTLRPTSEQVEILALLKKTEDNFMVNALAGTGKTTTLDMIQSASKSKPIMCIAFNRRAADDMEKKFGGSTTTIRTFNGLGHRVWMKTCSKVSLNPKKSQELFKEHANALSKAQKNEAYEVYWEVINGIALAKALGYVPDGKFSHAKRLISHKEFQDRLEDKPSSLTLELIDTLLTLSIKTAYNGYIDYNDQVYMPALFGGTFPRFPLTLIDEGQDQNPVNHAMLEKLVKGRLGVVGDRFQSIYQFRGAVSSGMEVLRQRWACEERPLTVSFRCPKAIVENARWRVPTFKFIREGGHVEVCTHLNARDIPEGAAILCRNNAPLFRTALGLLMAGRSVTVSGSEVGPKLVSLLKRICDEDDSQAVMLSKIEDWKDEKLTNSQSTDTVRDMADCLKIFASFGKTLAQAVAYVEHMFKQQGAIKLMTGHKAKGAEFNQVFHLDPWLIKDEGGEQELNLRYVIQTRSADKYFEIDSSRIKW